MRNSASPHGGAAQLRLLKALAHPARLGILAILRRREACACHLAAALDRPQAYASQQLAILRQAGLIDARRSGTYMYYRLRDHAVLGLVDISARMAEDRPPAPRSPRACRCPQCQIDRHAGAS